MQRYFVPLTVLILYLTITPPAEALNISGQRIVFYAPASESVHTSDIEMLDRNDIVVAWREQYVASGIDGGDIFSAWSADGGNTWSPRVIVAQTDANFKCGNVILFTHGTTIYAFIGKVPINAPNADAEILTSMKSLDKGHTWIKNPISNNYSFTIIPGGKVLFNGTEYLLPYHRDNGVVGVLASRDLVAWSAKSTVPNYSGRFLQEPFIVKSCCSDTLLMLMRVDAGDYAYSSTSSDNGATWTRATVDLGVPNFNSKSPLASTNGKYVVLYNTSRSRAALGILTRIHGQRWENLGIFASGGSQNTYPMLIEYGPGEFFTVAERDGKSIIFRKLDIN